MKFTGKGAAENKMDGESKVTPINFLKKDVEVYQPQVPLTKADAIMRKAKKEALEELLKNESEKIVL